MVYILIYSVCTSKKFDFDNKLGKIVKITSIIWKCSNMKNKVITKLKYVSKFLWFLYLHMNEKLAIFLDLIRFNRWEPNELTLSREIMGLSLNYWSYWNQSCWIGSVTLALLAHEGRLCSWSELCGWMRVSGCQLWSLCFYVSGLFSWLWWRGAGSSLRRDPTFRDT